MDWKSITADIVRGSIILAVFAILIGISRFSDYKKQREIEELRNQWRVTIEAQPVNIKKAIELGIQLYGKLGTGKTDELWNEFMSHPYIQQMIADYEAIKTIDENHNEALEQFKQKYGLNEYDVISFEILIIPQTIETESELTPELRKTLKEMIK
jgi:hypothetical protein